eukprot:8387902-Pyramimonas_sp.AAC.1
MGNNGVGVGVLRPQQHQPLVANTHEARQRAMGALGNLGFNIATTPFIIPIVASSATRPTTIPTPAAPTSVSDPARGMNQIRNDCPAGASLPREGRMRSTSASDPYRPVASACRSLPTLTNSAPP